MDYEVKLEIFEGPLDLLLHLIHKNEVDIFDIPIASITDQYLEYLEVMKALNINVAGDFLVMASTLIHIKSKMLLPELKEDEEDPREEITRPLLEYMRFKEAAHELSEREVLDRDVFSRRTSDYLQSQIGSEEPLMDVNIFQLMDAFKRIVNLRLPGVQLKLKIAKWSVEEKTEFIISILRQKREIFFHELFDEDRNLAEFVVTFLALLETIHVGLVKVFQPGSEGKIRLLACFDEKEV